MKKIWHLKEIESHEISRLNSELKISDTLSKVFINRGIKSKKEAQDFFLPTLEKLPNPFLMEGVKKSVSRIIEAINSKEKIVVYGDFDCDGITSTAILYSFLSSLGCNIKSYNPDRLEEGYGINIESINQLAADGYSLFITTDCGISENEVITKSKNLEVDFIITDHHTIPTVLPDAFSIINPKLSNCEYPYKDICAAGVIFNLIVAIRSGLREDGFFDDIAEPNLARYLDLVSIGTIADSMPITGVNRIFVSNGLLEIKNTTRKGLKHLISKNKDRFSVRDVSFDIAPKINAAGRVGKASNAVNLLVSDDDDEMEEYLQRWGGEDAKEDVEEAALAFFQKAGPGRGPGLSPGLCEARALAWTSARALNSVLGPVKPLPWPEPGWPRSWALRSQAPGLLGPDPGLGPWVE